MKIASWFVSSLISIALLVGISLAQQPVRAPAENVELKEAPPGNAPAVTVFEKVEPAAPAAVVIEEKPPVVKADGTPAIVDEIPKPIVVKETQPTGAAVPAPSEAPKLSSPVPPPETVVVAPKVRYFAIIFGSESVPKLPRYSHTWFTIVKATPKPDLPPDYDPNGNQVKYYDLTAHTISWLPRSLKIRALRFRPEPGMNLPLHDTIRNSRCNGEVLGMWGPYEVNPLIAEDLYNRTVKQIQRLNSGAVLYKAIDPDQPPASLRICDCIHAVSDMDGPGRRFAYDEMQRYGFEASEHVAAVMIRANRLDASVTHEWVADALDLNRYPFRRQLIGKCAPVQTPAATTAATASESTAH